MAAPPRLAFPGGLASADLAVSAAASGIWPRRTGRGHTPGMRWDRPPDGTGAASCGLATPG